MWVLVSGGEMVSMCTLSSDVDGAVVRPLPRAKRMLSDATTLPHVAQVCSLC